MIYSIVNYDVFRGNFLSYETLLLSGKTYMVKSTIKCLTFLKSKSLKEHTLKTALQEPFRKKDSMFCEKEASLTKTAITDVSFFLVSCLGL